METRSRIRLTVSQSVCLGVHCLIREYWVPFQSPLTTRRDYGASILTRPHTGTILVETSRIQGGSNEHRDVSLGVFRCEFLPY
jgi:hypothetical protein